MSKITLNDYESFNELAVEKYFLKQYSVLNEYFYIQEPYIIHALINKIKENNVGHYEQQVSAFLTGFFWNQKKDEYSIAENIGKLILRLNSFQEQNVLIEVKQLSLEEKINFIHNINTITKENSYLHDMFDLKGQRFSDKIIELLNNKDILENIKSLYCNDWIDYNDMLNSIGQEIIFMKNIDLNIHLNNKLKPIKNLKRHKI